MTADASLGVTQSRVIASEWVKFRSLRSTWWSVGAALLVSVGLGILFSELRGNDIANGHGFEADQTALSLRGFFLAQLAIGVLGVLFITGEYGTGMIRATLSAEPRRYRVWVGKIVTVAGVIFVISLAASFAAFLGGQAVLSQFHVEARILTPKGVIDFQQLGVSLGHAGSLRAVFGAALYMVGVALLGLGCGFAIRNTGGAIAALFGLLLVLPLLAQALPTSLQNDITKYLPMIAGTAGMATIRGSNELGAWAGLGVFGLYVVAALGVGLWVLRRRDA